MGRYITHSPAETAQLAERLAGVLHGGDLLTFSGGLGVGKTTFCAGLAKGLGCTDPVFSPTYALVNYYRGPLPLAHFDAWRIQSEDDLEAAGLFEYLAAGAVVAIEWSERVEPLLPPAQIRVHIHQLSATEREILIEGAEGF